MGAIDWYAVNRAPFLHSLFIVLPDSSFRSILRILLLLLPNYSNTSLTYLPLHQPNYSPAAIAGGDQAERDVKCPVSTASYACMQRYLFTSWRQRFASPRAKVETVANGSLTAL